VEIGWYYLGAEGLEDRIEGICTLCADVVPLLTVEYNISE
jgi:hypothetical protein